MDLTPYSALACTICEPPPSFPDRLHFGYCFVDWHLSTSLCFLCYLIYLSLMVVGEPFLSFQWDALLTETLLLSLFFLPFTKFHKLSDHLAISSVGRLLIISLLAKLMIESGIVKFTFCRRRLEYLARLHCP